MSIRPRVSLLRCADYSADLREKLEQLLLPLGGLAAFVSPGQSVLLKPNLLSDSRPDQAVTTHPELVRALIRLLRKLGVNPRVADSPNNVVKLERVWEMSGFSAMCAEEKVDLLNLSTTGATKFDVDGFSFHIARPVLDARLVINLPKVKTHTLTIFTGAVKNMYGAVPGFLKTHLHKLHPRPTEFGRLIAAIYKTVPPALNIADGIVGMEGDGPSAGKTVRLGFLAASPDAVALDLVLCDILGIPPRTVPYLRPFLDEYTDPARGWRLETVGESPRGLAPASFRVPSTLRGQLIPGPLVRLLWPFIWIRPRVSDKCVSCGRCVQACPTNALRVEPGNKPILDPRKCIGCCCCHEVCPEKAIRMTQSPLLTLAKGKEIA